ncbi:MAG: MarR family transcriptional regulator [Syntrophomonadaceae bacterium]|nr:MarR family transcriptional regulator [Syntrophomonadaceae bacterium]
MDKEEAQELHLLLFTLAGFVHKKFWLNLRKHSCFAPRANKNQVKIINILYYREGLTPTEIGQMLDLEKGSLTTILDQLEEMGFIVRRVDPNDRRKLLVSLSRAGRDQMDKTMSQYTESLVKLFKDVEDEEKATFIRSLRHVVDFIKKL